MILPSGKYVSRPGKRFSEVEIIKSSVKHFFTDIPLQDFKICCEQWPKRWEYYKELKRDYFLKNSRLRISVALKINLKKLVSKLGCPTLYSVARGSTVGSATVLETGRTRVRFSMRSLGFFN
jgi:hypothetical protein